jgi:hypothetical protein
MLENEASRRAFRFFPDSYRDGYTQDYALAQSGNADIKLAKLGESKKRKKYDTTDRGV